jgi:hypothetical protein
MKTLIAKNKNESRDVLVDDADYEWLSKYSWQLMKNGYAIRGTNSQGRFLMHREIMGLSPGDRITVDHINRDRLDNRRSNLRLLSHSDNCRNRGADRGSTSAFVGVSWDRTHGKWIASAHWGGKRIALGAFTEEIDAALAAITWRHDNTPVALY